jgi:hypothetical protein
LNPQRKWISFPSNLKRKQKVMTTSFFILNWSDEVKKDSYRFFSILVEDQDAVLEFELKSLEGDSCLHFLSVQVVGIYISNKIRRPTQTNYTWASQSLKDNLLRIQSKDPQFQCGTYFIGIYGYKTDCKFSLIVYNSRCPLLLFTHTRVKEKGRMLGIR